MRILFSFYLSKSEIWDKEHKHKHKQVVESTNFFKLPEQGLERCRLNTFPNWNKETKKLPKEKIFFLTGLMMVFNFLKENGHADIWHLHYTIKQFQLFGKITTIVIAVIISFNSYKKDWCFFVNFVNSFFLFFFYCKSYLKGQLPFRNYEIIKGMDVKKKTEQVLFSRSVKFDMLTHPKNIFSRVYWVDWRAKTQLFLELPNYIAKLQIKILFDLGFISGRWGWPAPLSHYSIV